jgi:prepilin-type N-terminal cleavage/methylation domain-containing protein
MKRQMNSTAANVRRGFTLTELLIVMAILVLLVSLVGPRLLGSKAKADVNSVKTQIGMFQSSLERYATIYLRSVSIESTWFPRQGTQHCWPRRGGIP